MKSVLFETANVKRLQKVMKKMLTKKGADLILVYGYPGTGKSHFAKKSFAKPGWGYYRIETMDTARSFLAEVYRSLNYALTGNETTIKGTSSTLAKACIDLFGELSFLRDQSPDIEPYVFIFDEVNLAIQHHKWQVLELIRDFRDIAGAKIMMIGEEDTKARLEKYNAHFFNRCSNFCQFEVPNLADMLGVAVSSMEVAASKDVYGMMANKAKGSLHQLESIIKEFEYIGKQKGITKLEVSDIIEAANEL